MLNPFIIGLDRKWEKGSRPLNEERNAQVHGTPLKQPARRNQMTLRLGALLIRMGKGLTGEATLQAGSRASWSRGNPTDTRPAGFHHA